MKCVTYNDLVAADVDGQLTPEEQDQARQHLSSCAACRSTRERQLVARRALRERLRTPQLSASARERIRAAIPADIRGARHLATSRRIVLGGAVAALLALAVGTLVRAPEAHLFAALRADLAAAKSDLSPFDLRTESAAELRNYYRRNGVAFDNTVEDLSTSGLKLIGGTVSAVGSTTTTMSVYEGSHGKVVCRRFPADAIRLPRGGETIGDSRVFAYQGVQIALRRLGGVVCAMASDMSRERFLHSMHASHAAHTF